MLLTNRASELSGRVKQLEAENDSLKYLLQTKASVDVIAVYSVIGIQLTSSVR